MEALRRFWHAQRAFFGNDWVAGFAWWGGGVSGWALWRWTTTPPLPLVAGLLIVVLMISPLIRFVFVGLAGREPSGQRGRAWAVWYLAAQCSRPPLTVLARTLDLLALIVGPLLLADALLTQHVALVIVALTPLLWRVSSIQMLTRLTTQGVH